ncbi:SOS response-associated peptidase family protein [Luteimonas sp. MC1782]|uniref:SOS response-associated peptidase family protein n=1 Tax=Luteimonas sp. MC1782 TaxID=2760305 RepID=UPI0016029AA3|nr:SOS response-associated peptidase family protein [Luteimonas sp. MC1782]MBB1473496.1 SOS response-associated peptidase family protein [Luteimonas sp. MC1782]
MCYSAQVRAEHRKFQRQTGATMELKDYVRLYWSDKGDAGAKRPKVPRALEIGFLRDGPPEIADLIRQWDAREMSTLEQELFKQRKRVADGERSLQAKVTKKAQEDMRIGMAKVEQIRGRIDALKRSEPKPDDARIYPGHYTHVLVGEGGKRVMRPMRYQCRPAGKPAFYDRKFPGTYNARRDSLEGFWKPQFGRHHALMVADVFYENVAAPDGRNQVLAFTPRTGEPMLIACLWSHWTDPAGVEPDLDSFAAITDDPEPEVAAAGHDRTVINIRPEHIDAWLNPDPANLQALYAIFDDRQHPFYEHREAA